VARDRPQRQAGQAIGAISLALKERIRQVPPHAYTAAERFLRGLDYEIQLLTGVRDGAHAEVATHAPGGAPPIPPTAPGPVPAS